MSASTNEIKFSAACLADTDRLGAALAGVLPPGTTIALCGTLGAGKTRLTQAIAAGLGIPRDEVVSPTFVLHQPYQGTKMLYHFDAYRIRDDDEFLELGPEEYFDSDGITIIEWADRVSSCLPLDYLQISIDVTGDSSREFTIAGCGEVEASMIELLQAKLDDSHV